MDHCDDGLDREYGFQEGVMLRVGCAWAQHELAYSRWAGVKALSGQQLLLVDLPDAHAPLCPTTQCLHRPITPPCGQRP